MSFASQIFQRSCIHPNRRQVRLLASLWVYRTHARAPDRPRSVREGSNVFSFSQFEIGIQISLIVDLTRKWSLSSILGRWACAVVILYSLICFAWSLSFLDLSRLDQKSVRVVFPMVCQGIWTRRWSRKFTAKTTYQWARRLDLGCTVMLHNLWFENQMRNKVV